MPSNTIRQTLADSTPGYYRDDETGDYYRATELLADVVSGYAQPSDSGRLVFADRENAAGEPSKMVVTLTTPAGARTYGRLSHSSDSGGYDIDGRATRRNASSWSEGDVVEYDSDGHIGVVTAKLTDDFTVPKGDDDEVDAEASTQNPAYIVARETSGFGVFRASDLSKGSFPDDVPGGDPSELANASENRENARGSSHGFLGFRPGEPPGWNRKSYLQAYAHLGGTWTTCVAQMEGDISSPKRWCSDLKDEVLHTTRWRGRF